MTRRLAKDREGVGVGTHGFLGNLSKAREPRKRFELCKLYSSRWVVPEHTFCKIVLGQVNKVRPKRHALMGV